MLTEYIEAAMRGAHYEILEYDRSIYGAIAVCPGVWANEATLEECREILQEVLEDWILLHIKDNFQLPIIGGIDINLQQAA